MKILLLIPCLLLQVLTYAQDWEIEKPNYKKIEKNIKKKKSNLFYDSLMDRYLKSDSTMTLEEKRHLYYGFIYEDNYSPYGFSDYRDSLRTVYKKPKLETSDWYKIAEFSDSILVEDPFNMDAMNYQLNAFKQLGNSKSFDNTMMKISILVDALISSGNGTSKEKAFYVISTSHEYTLLDVFGFDFGGSQSLIEHYDYLEVGKNDVGIEGLYFDVTPCLNSMNALFK